MRFSSRSKVVLATLVLTVITACGGGGGDNGSGGSPVVSAPSALSYTSPQTYTVGTAITALNSTVTGTVASYSVSPALPAGLTLSTTSGQITGTPTTATAPGSYTITAQNSAGATAFGLSITVNAALSLEPGTTTIIGRGQTIEIFAALRNSSADPYPVYIDPATITWTSSQPGIVSMDGDGHVTGLGEGTTTITSEYQGLVSQLVVQVSGQWLRHDVSVTGQGIRQYFVYVPAFGSDADPHPAILSLHGGGGSAMIQASTSQLNQLADEQKVFVVYLEGSGVIQTFNAGGCCGFAQSQNVDDVLYARTVLDDFAASYDVDTAEIFATGFSNGGMMSHRLACALSDRIAAIAPIGGGSGQFDGDLNQYYTCSPTRPIPVLHMHATNDRNYPFAGGVGEGVAGANFYSVDATIADWVSRNNVTTEVAVENVTATTTCYHYRVRADTTRPSAPVSLCKTDPPDNYDPVNDIVFGGGHSWPGGVRSPSPSSDVPIADFDANAYLWNFFQQS